MVLRTHPNRCPQCRERVTPFAAGCAYCGADLDPRRNDKVPIGRRIGSAWDALTVRPELLLAAFAVIVALSYVFAF